MVGESYQTLKCKKTDITVTKDLTDKTAQK